MTVDGKRVVVVMGMLDDKFLVDLDDRGVVRKAVCLEGSVVGDVAVVVEIIMLEEEDEVCNEDLDGEEELGLVVEDGVEVVDLPGVEEKLDEGEEGAGEVEPNHQDGPAVGGLPVVVVEDLRDVLADTHADLDEPERGEEMHPVEAVGDGDEALGVVDVVAAAEDVEGNKPENGLGGAAQPLVVVLLEPPAVRLRENERVGEEVVQAEDKVVEPDQRPLAVFLEELLFHDRGPPHHACVERVEDESHHVEVHVVDRDPLHGLELGVADHRRVVGNPPPDDVDPSYHVRDAFERHCLPGVSNGNKNNSSREEKETQEEQKDEQEQEEQEVQQPQLLLIWDGGRKRQFRRPVRV